MLQPPPLDYELTRPRDEVDEFLIMKYPHVSLVVVGLYIWFIKSYGPKFMAKKEPYKLTNTIRLYNVAQVVFNSYIVGKLFTFSLSGIRFSEILNDYTMHYCHYFNTPDNPTYVEVMKLLNFIMFTKIFDFLDSVFMTLKKRYRQLSFLHVYHHAVVVTALAYTMHFREGLGIALLYINSFIHIIMYSYYLLSSIDSLRLKLTFLKQMITKFQIAQFVIMLVYTVSAWKMNCSMGFMMTTFNPLMVISFLILFINFYVKSYNLKKKSKH